MNEEKNLKKTLRAIEKSATGFVTKEIISEYVVDDDGQLKLAKQKINKKTLPPNSDAFKLLYQMMKDKVSDYENMTDEQLENEKLRLLNEIIKKENIYANKKSKQ
ncbi:MAG: hypothetical protein PHP83_03205 [Clostridia bacterium]|nr:hypothetical protein [Clostridia bacterium]